MEGSGHRTATYAGRNAGRTASAMGDSGRRRRERRGCAGNVKMRRVVWLIGMSPGRANAWPRPAACQCQWRLEDGEMPVPDASASGRCATRCQCPIWGKRPAASAQPSPSPGEATPPPNLTLQVES